MTCMIELAYCLSMAVYTLMYVTEETSTLAHGYHPLVYEEGRELCGLLIAACWITLCLTYRLLYELVGLSHQ